MLKPRQVAGLSAVGIATFVLAILLSNHGLRQVCLFVIGLLLGGTLYQAAFGFSAAYRKAMKRGQFAGIYAQIIMLSFAMLLFAPFLSVGQAFGRDVMGAVAPVSLSMAFGALLFGVGMQFGGGCASGTLFSVGGGAGRSLWVLVFFCLGGFWGSLDLSWWAQRPGIGPVALADHLGYPLAIGCQLAALVLIWVLLRQAGGRPEVPIWRPAGTFRQLFVNGPWPLGPSAMSLAVLNWLYLVTAGHPWSITWAFALWVAKLLQAFGWDPATNEFWSGNFQQQALQSSVLQDATSVTNIGIMLGAAFFSFISGRFRIRFSAGRRDLLLMTLGGLAMGYGARLSYGCNIGAFFSGIASTSLHGWIWIFAAIPGNYLGILIKRIIR